MTDTQEEKPAPDTETYTPVEIDQLGGALLYAGGLHHTLMHLLDTTNDPATLELWEYVNHAPVGMALSILNNSALALYEARVRLDEHGEAVAAALNSLSERAKAKLSENDIELTDAELDEVFNRMMVDTFGPEAKKNGLD